MEQYRKARNRGIWASLIIGYGGRLLVLPLSGGNYTTALTLSIVLAVIAIAVSIWACVNWARMKNRSPWWSLWGIAAPLGYIPLAILRTK